MACSCQPAFLLIGFTQKRFSIKRHRLVMFQCHRNFGDVLPKIIILIFDFFWFLYLFFISGRLSWMEKIIQKAIPRSTISLQVNTIHLTSWLLAAQFRNWITTCERSDQPQESSISLQSVSIHGGTRVWCLSIICILLTNKENISMGTFQRLNQFFLTLSCEFGWT
jgi:hypothetical protein